MKRVWLDPGHGGDDNGASNVEDNLNLELAKKLYGILLAQHNVEPVLMRTSDIEIPLSERIARLNKEFPAHQDGLIVSVHHNAAPADIAFRENWRGFEVIYAPGSRRGSAAAEEVLLAVCAAALFKRAVMLDTDQIARHLGIMLRTYACSIVIENGYLTNGVDLKNANDPEFRKKLAGALADGITAYLAKD